MMVYDGKTGSYRVRCDDISTSAGHKRVPGGSDRSLGKTIDRSCSHG